MPPKKSECADAKGAWQAIRTNIQKKSFRQRPRQCGRTTSRRQIALRTVPYAGKDQVDPGHTKRSMELMANQLMPLVRIAIRHPPSALLAPIKARALA
jgi:hypothetical protein